MECGIGLSDFTDLKEGDVIETYDEREIPIAQLLNNSFNSEAAR